MNLYGQPPNSLPILVATATQILFYSILFIGPRKLNGAAPQYLCVGGVFSGIFLTPWLAEDPQSRVLIASIAFLGLLRCFEMTFVNRHKVFSSSPGVTLKEAVMSCLPLKFKEPQTKAVRLYILKQACFALGQLLPLNLVLLVLVDMLRHLPPPAPWSVLSWGANVSIPRHLADAPRHAALIPHLLHDGPQIVARGSALQVAGYRLLVNLGYALVVYLGNAAMFALVRALCALLTRGRATLVGMYNRPYLSTSPRDFWSNRWNLLVKDVFHEAVFLPLGGRRRPLLAAAAVFLVSGLFHEYLNFASFGNPAPGEMTVFFAIQFLATASQVALQRALPSLRSAVPAVISAPLTLLFMCATGSLFLNPFLAADFPRLSMRGQWLQDWDAVRRAAPALFSPPDLAVASPGP